MCFLGEAQILHLMTAWTRQGLAGLGSITWIILLPFCRSSIAPITPLLQNKGAGQCSARGTVRLSGWSWLGLGLAQPGSGPLVGGDARARRQVFTANWGKKTRRDCVELSGEM